MELHEALRQISEIRQQMAHSEVFRGYRSLTVGVSGAIGLLAAGLQAQWVLEPNEDLGRYLVWWMAAAVISVVVTGGEMFLKAIRGGSSLERDMTLLAVEQFMPCLGVGALLTCCVYFNAPQVAWMLPGLWSLIFSLGVFASHRLLPRPAIWIGVYYAASGSLCLIAGQREPLAPWQMALSFGGGQLLAASILYWNLERRNAR